MACAHRAHGPLTIGRAVVAVSASVSLEQVRSAERALSVGTWTITFGAVLYSVLTVTPLMAGHTPAEWRWTSPILPLVTDSAVVIVVRMDSVLARLGGDGGGWPVVLRWMTGLMTLLLNVGLSALNHDLVGVAVHAVAPLLLIVSAEASRAYRRSITRALEKRQATERAERERAAKERGRLAREERQAELDTAERRERERREHDAQMAREQREHEARMRSEERAEQARQEATVRAERDRREREVSERERREREAAERERAERAEDERRAQAHNDRVRQDLLVAPAVSERLSEERARQMAGLAAAVGIPQRRAVELTGWSAGWVAARYQEARDAQAPAAALHAVPDTA